MVVKIIKKAMKEDDWAAKKYLIDGFPRDKDDKKAWETVMGHDVDFKFLLFLEADQDVMLKRIMGRAKIASEAGEKARVDDNEETAKKRIKIFNEKTKPIIKIYEAENKVKRVNADGTIDQVYNDVKKAFEGVI